MNSYNDSSQPLKERGITLMSVGVGDRVNQYELQKIVTSPDHAILVNTLDDAIASVANVANVTCLGKLNVERTTCHFVWVARHTSFQISNMPYLTHFLSFL